MYELCACVRGPEKRGKGRRCREGTMRNLNITLHTKVKPYSVQPPERSLRCSNGLCAHHCSWFVWYSETKSRQVSSVQAHTYCVFVCIYFDVLFFHFKIYSGKIVFGKLKLNFDRTCRKFIIIYLTHTPLNISFR